MSSNIISPVVDLVTIVWSKRTLRCGRLSGIVRLDLIYDCFTSFTVCLQSHLAELDADDVPTEVASQKDVVFANIKDIYGFHTR